MLNGKSDPNNMKTVQEYFPTVAWKGLCGSKKLPPNIHVLLHVHTLGKHATEHNSTNHRTPSNHGTCLFQSCTSQLLNLTQHMEECYLESMITETPFVDLSAAYDTLNHKIAIQKLTTQRRLVQYVDLSRICCQIYDYIWS